MIHCAFAQQMFLLGGQLVPIFTVMERENKCHITHNYGRIYKIIEHEAE